MYEAMHYVTLYLGVYLQLINMQSRIFGIEVINNFSKMLRTSTGKEMMARLRAQMDIWFNL